ncbi:MAG: hypothetical protein JW821_02205, partial [Deltaproteobacteria bacterium]|nr:hypothetical protein [Deltaproteobacteria bacterium]
GGITGFVVDCRGIEVKPALVPRIMDENGNVVYGSAYVSRDHAVKEGMVGYVQEIEAMGDHFRSGATPLVVKGIRTADAGATDIVISNADGARIRGSASNLELLQRCRVTILLD